MPSPVELALTSLLPTLPDLPPELIELATSLLAQSRSKAANLKPEEEIGRTYACCHIACQRLGHRLALEIGKPAPPVKPKVYAKLHTYLNSVLKTTVTPRKSKQNEGATSSTPASASRTASRIAQPTPKKDAVKASSTPIGKASASQETHVLNDYPYPEYEMPQYENVPTFEDSTEDVADEAAEDSDRGPLTPSRKRAAKTPLRRKEKHAKRATADGGDDEEDVCAAGLQPALGTMFQPAIDWLSDERRADYARWEKGIRREIAKAA